MASVKIYVTSSFYNGDLILGWKVDGDVDVELVELDTELPDPWDIDTVEEADAGLKSIADFSAIIREVEAPNDELSLERDAWLEDLEYLIDEITEIREDLESGEPNRLHAAYGSDVGQLVAAEHTDVYDDDLPSDVQASIDEYLDSLDSFCD